MTQDDLHTTLAREGYTLMDEGQTFIDHVGPIWRRLSGADGSSLRVHVQRQHTNPNRSVHGGLLMTLMDVTLGSAAEAALQASAGHQGDGRHPITLQLSCSLLAAAEEGAWLEATGRVDRLTRTMAFVSGDIRAGNRLLMTGSAVFKIPGG